MSKAAKTIIAFGIYMAATGAFLAIAPNILLPPLGLPPTNEPWIRVLGMFMIVVSYYYYRTAKAEATEFFRATVHGRTGIAIFLTALVLLHLSRPVLVLFGLAEVVGAATTALALRSSSGRVDSRSAATVRNPDR